MYNQELFNTIENITGYQCLSSEMAEISKTAVKEMEVNGINFSKRIYDGAKLLREHYREQLILSSSVQDRERFLIRLDEVQKWIDAYERPEREQEQFPG